MLIKRLQIFFITWTLVLSQSVHAVDVSTLTPGELATAKKLGLSESDINSLDADALKNTLNEKLTEEKAGAREKLELALKEKIEPKIEEVKADLKKDAEKLVAAYITSTISLFAATLIAPQVVKVCGTKPSAMVYAGTAAVYVFQEMRNIQVLKASQLAEIEVVDNLSSIDKTKSAKENGKELNAKVDQQVGYIKAYKSTLDSAVRALKEKAKNARIVSIGFLAASATALAEQMDWISGGGACAAAIPVKKSNSKYTKIIDFIQANIFLNAMAADSKKVTVSEQLKDNKAADWVGDLDKLGIVGGLAINVVAYMNGWKIGFLESAMASGTSRAIVFGVQSALAFTASKLFDNAADSLENKLAKIDDLINGMQKVAQEGINVAVIHNSDAKKFQEMAAKLGIPSDKMITEMSTNEADEYIKQVKAKSDTLDEEGKALLKKFETETKQKIESSKKSTSTTFLPNLLNIIFTNAYAANAVTPYSVTRIKNLKCVEQKSCPSIQFPKSANPNAKILNQYLNLYEGYYQGVQVNNSQVAEKSYAALEKNKSLFSNYREAIFKKLQEKNKSAHTSYDQYERAGVAREVANFSKFYNSLSPDERSNMDAGLNPLSRRFASNMGTQSNAKSGSKPTAKLTSEERKIISLLIDRLEDSESTAKGPNMNFIERDNKEKDEYIYGNTSIHPKEVELFDVIHVRYLKFIQKNFPEL